MSYNVTMFKLKKLKDLQIPFDNFFIHEREDYHPDVEYDAKENVTLHVCEGGIIDGKLNDGILYVDNIDDLTGEFSGSVFHEILEPALKTSVGEFEAVMVWEGGDSINKIIVKDGIVKWENVEL